MASNFLAALFILMMAIQVGARRELNDDIRATQAINFTANITKTVQAPKKEEE